MQRGLGLHNQDKDAPVALTAWGEKGEGVREAIELCDGFKDLDPSMRVLLKPNLVVWLEKYPYAPNGVITTSTVIEETIKALKDRGVQDITIADGCARNKEMGSETHILFERLGYTKWVDRYGVKLVDFNQGAHEEMEFGPHKLKVSTAISECDYMINLPALKTHELTRVTLGFKNLKGILHPKTKQACHNPHHTVDEYLVRIAERFYPNLTIIDGAYMLEMGPMFTGQAQRADLVVASRDMFSADLVGATLMGVDPAEVRHLSDWAGEQGRSLNLSQVEVKGLEFADHARKLMIDTPWAADGSMPMAWKKQGIEGFDLPFPLGVCTGCTYVFPPANLLILSAKTDEPFAGFELLAGKGAKSFGRAETTFLMGNCPIKEHKNNDALNNVVKIAGCPPTVDDVARALTENGIQVHMGALDRFFGYLVKRYEKFNFPKEEYWVE